MLIERYNIPKLPRSKYTVVGLNAFKGNNTVINNITNNSELYDGLDSTSTDKGLTANMGKFLNDNKLSKTNKDTALEVITFASGLESKMDIKAGGFGPTSTGIGAAIYLNNSDWNVIADNATFRKQTTIGEKLVTFDYDETNNTGAIIYKDSNSDWNVIADNATFRKQTTIGEKLVTSDYDIANNTGAAIYKDENGQWNFDIDNAKIRGKLDIDTLIVNEAEHISGNIYCTKAGFKCNRVERFEHATGDVRYRCYFNAVDALGLKVYNQFHMGDLAFCQTFNNNKVRKWWRLVLGIGENYIDVSEIDCWAGSNAPEAGDNIVQLGNATVDDTRKGAVIIWTDSICVYKGINDYVLPEPIIRLDPNNTKISADTIEFLGTVIANGNFVVDEKGNLKIKGSVTANDGKIGSFIINERGLYNDDGFAEIEFAHGDYGFSIGTQHNVGLVDAWTRTDDVLNVSSEYGTAVNAYSNSGWGLISSKTKVEGLHIAANRYDYQTYHILLSTFDDFITFNSDKTINLDLPEITKDTIGKVYHFKNLGTGDVVIWGNIVLAKSNIASEKLTINTPTPFTLVCDKTLWYQI